MRRTVLAVVVVLALVAVAVSVDQLLDLEDRKERADRASVDSRRDRADVDAQAAGLEAVIDRLAVDGRNHRAGARTIEATVIDIGELRAAVDGVVDALTLGRADRAVRQAKIDLLLGCRDTLDAAVAQLDGDQATPASAAAVLDEGRAQCQAALDQVQGDTGAVHPYDFPDPSIVLVGDTYYAYATEGPGGPIQTMSSPDLVTWTVRPTALANRPAWARAGSTWAPTVHQFGDRFVLYYAARSKVSGQLCISSAAGLAPAGPFLDDSLAPLVCQDDLGGSIDPNVHVDENGFAKLTWKSEDETEGGASKIWTQYLGGDGRSVVGPAVVLLWATEPWEDQIIENPSMVRFGDLWLLLYAGNRWNSADYAMGYAVCATSLGPCFRTTTGPTLRSTGGYEGPGGAHAFRSRGGQTVLAYAAWDPDRIGYPNSRRLHLAVATYADGTLALRDL